MQQERVIVKIRKDGTVGIEVDGVTGGGCENVTRPLEERLGVVTSRTHKPEYFQETSVQQELSTGEGL